MSKKTIPVAIALAIAATGVGGYVMASSGDDDTAERAAIASASITMQQAIQVAVQEVDGLVLESEVEDDNGTFYYEIEILAADDTEKEVLIDMASGDVVSVSAEDENDENDD